LGLKGDRLIGNQQRADFSFGSDLPEYRNPTLKVYLKVILQLTTLSLLFSLSSSAAATLPAILPSKPMDLSKVTVAEVYKPLTKDLEIKDYAPITDPKNVARYVSDYFEDIPLLARIAACESHNRQYDSKGNVLRGEKNSHDIGVMQINELYHLDDSLDQNLDIYTIEGNVAFARHIYEKQGAKPWMSSSACWSKYTQKELARI